MVFLLFLFMFLFIFHHKNGITLVNADLEECDEEAGDDEDKGMY